MAMSVSSAVVDVTPGAADLVGSDGQSPLDYILPMGPACPFRSQEMVDRNLDAELSASVQRATRYAGEFGQLAASFQAGIQPDKTRTRAVGEEMKKQGDTLKSILDELDASLDFQAKESYMALEASAQRNGVPTIRTVQRLVSWQADGLLAFSEGRPLSAPPADVNALANVAPGAAGVSDPNNRVMMEVEISRALPFDDECFEAASGPEVVTVKGDYERLIRDHRQIVGLGENYRNFDAAGKEYYLDQLAQIAFRWEELIAAGTRAGVLVSPAFKAFSEEYLQRAGYTPVQYRDFVEKIHDHFRKEVAKEKAIGR